MKKLTQQINGTSLAIFRIGFGLIMIWELIYFLRLDFVKVFLIDPQVQFTYSFLPFLKPLPEPILDVLLIVLMVACFFITIGRYYKQAMIVFFVGFTYIFLLDKAYYNNHLYLICLLSFLMIFIPADDALSFKKNKEKTATPPLYWHILILRLQLALVYFFGGVAKLNYDWLISNEPVRSMLANLSKTSFLGDALTSNFSIYFFTYGGLLFDLLIPFLLFIPKTRKMAVLMALLFNVLNAWIFEDINIFPYFMMLSLLLFLDTDRVANFVRKKVEGKKTSVQTAVSFGNLKKPMLVVLGVYFLIQLILPVRHLLYNGNTDWTGLGQRFAWRMKIQHRTLEKMEFKVWDVQKKVIYPVGVDQYGLNQDQINLLAFDPTAILQFADFLKTHTKKNKSMNDVLVKATVEVTFNGRAPQKIFNDDLNLLDVGSSASELSKWIQPLNTNR
ncbi:HTTM domain-containing protein [Ulvibacter litoralis]|uniref:Vitamin K-dependent gamma-carboxylase n=1 Tax=Ulvibacter litoralis TaxID=227084 RepID=A0A1G7J021_9FLAO|nr:HTTM domain-containing protein [Ulvibacter litoralis]GHC60356.1 gamma-glutamyl carboxylase [Ulvibacter litoralis]SDF18213.1 Vitamin K-dependent gamma-carboxylase [Ulvibacter litoralis]